MRKKTTILASGVATTLSPNDAKPKHSRSKRTSSTAQGHERRRQHHRSLNFNNVLGASTVADTALIANTVVAAAGTSFHIGQSAGHQLC
jgi:hypothetical protein